MQHNDANSIRCECDGWDVFKLNVCIRTLSRSVYVAELQCTRIYLSCIVLIEIDRE